jgi:hypothetical protein
MIGRNREAAPGEDAPMPPERITETMEPKLESAEPEPPPDEPELPPDEAAPAEEEERRRGRFDQFIPDIVKRTFYAGLGAVFTTEEGIRKLASDFHLPKDITNYLIQQAAASKDELFRVVAKELRGFLDSVNISGELQKLLTSLSFEIKTEIRFIPNSQAVGGVKPDMKIGKMSFKRSKEKKPEGDGSDEPQ